VLGAGLLERPTGLAVAPDRIWIADPPRHQVIALSFAGELLARVGTEGEPQRRFHYPTSLARDPDGTILVVDALNFRIVRLSPTGEWLGSFGEGEEDGLLARPKGIAAGPEGRVYVSDAQAGAVLCFTRAGELEFSIGETGSLAGQFALPAGLAVAQDRLLVADSQNRRIQQFVLLGGSS
jgi:sugar lactone lactonase YvrE